MSAPLTAHRARAHEALVPRIEALRRQAETLAARHPRAEPPAELKALSETLLYEAGRIVDPSRRAPRQALRPQAAPSLIGLATQLGQTAAALDSFEAEWTVWDASRQCLCWRLAHGTLMPLQRLRPQIPFIPDPAGMTEIKRRLIERIEQLKRP